MNFKITNNDIDEEIKIQIEFTVDSWEELRRIMEIIDDEVGV